MFFFGWGRGGGGDGAAVMIVSDNSTRLRLDHIKRLRHRHHMMFATHSVCHTARQKDQRCRPLTTLR